MSADKFMKCLNLGCGSRFIDGWTNLDIAPMSPKVQKCDLLRGIPCADYTFDFVYHSHLLEHIPAAKNAAFLGECLRVLKPGGVIRVVVPDLENIAREYLQYLEESLQGSVEGRARYEWMLLEMYDQAVRTRSGGEMAAYIQQKNFLDETFIKQRLGGEFDLILNSTNTKDVQPSRWLNLMYPRNWKEQSRRIMGSLRNTFYRLVLGRKNYQALKSGWFRQSGEVHQWMYDRYSLARILVRSGFIDPTQQTASRSRLPGWENIYLDINPDGSVYKPDSLYMEATRPS